MAIDLVLNDIENIRVKIEWAQSDEFSVRRVIKENVDELVDEMEQLIKKYNSDRTEHNYAVMMDCLTEINNLFDDDFVVEDFGVDA